VLSRCGKNRSQFSLQQSRMPDSLTGDTPCHGSRLSCTFAARSLCMHRQAQDSVLKGPQDSTRGARRFDYVTADSMRNLCWRSGGWQMASSIRHAGQVEIFGNKRACGGSILRQVTVLHFKAGHMSMRRRCSYQKDRRQGNPDGYLNDTTTIYFISSVIGPNITLDDKDAHLGTIIWRRAEQAATDAKARSMSTLKTNPAIAVIAMKDGWSYDVSARRRLCRTSSRPKNNILFAACAITRTWGHSLATMAHHHRLYRQWMRWGTSIRHDGGFHPRDGITVIKEIADQLFRRETVRHLRGHGVDIGYQYQPMSLLLLNMGPSRCAACWCRCSTCRPPA